MKFEQKQPGLFVVRYQERDDLEPARQNDLVGAVKKAAAKTSCAIVFVAAGELAGLLLVNR